VKIELKLGTHRIRFPGKTDSHIVLLASLTMTVLRHKKSKFLPHFTQLGL